MDFLGLLGVEYITGKKVEGNKFPLLGLAQRLAELGRHYAKELQKEAGTRKPFGGTGNPPRGASRAPGMGWAVAISRA